MNKNEFYYLGRILKTHGNKGHLLILPEQEDTEPYPVPDAVFFKIGHDFIPFMVMEFDLQSRNRILLKCEDVDTVSIAEQYTGLPVYLQASSIPQIVKKEAARRELEGFTVIDKNHGNIGIVNTVIEMPRQNLLSVNWHEKEILIPMAGEIILKTDRKKKIIYVDVPEGLIEIYLHK